MNSCHVQILHYPIKREHILVGAKFASPTKEILVVAFFATSKKSADSFQNGNSHRNQPLQKMQ